MTLMTVAGRTTQARVIRSEWTKFRSLRSSWWTVAITVLFTVGIGVLSTSSAASDHNSSTQPDSVATISQQGSVLAQLSLGVLAALLICSEYGTGMIRASMAVVPRRLPVLWGKIAIFVGVVLPLTTVTSFAAFLLGQLTWTAKGRTAVSLGDPGVLRIVAGTGFYLTMLGVLVVALGAIIRNTTAGVTTMVGLFFMLPVVMDYMPPSIGHYARYLPSNAGGALSGVTLAGHDALAPWPGFALLCGYTAVAMVAAGIRIRHTDA
jgi:ABC-type transport system involved in multi-copper enzyme maturation permease subunit